MKTYKNFNEHSAQGAIMHHNSIGVEDGGMDVHDIADPEVRKRVNAFVGSIADKEYLNANHAIAELRQKLMRVGLEFGQVDIYEGEGEVSSPLSQFGGRYGNDGSGTEDGQLVNDDGISHRHDGGLSISFKYMKLDNGRCKVFANIA